MPELLQSATEVTTSTPPESVAQQIGDDSIAHEMENADRLKKPKDFYRGISDTNIVEQITKDNGNKNDYNIVFGSLGWAAKRKVESGGVDKTKDRYSGTRIEDQILLGGGKLEDYNIVETSLGTQAKKKVEAGGQDDTKEEYTGRDENYLQNKILLDGGKLLNYNITQEGGKYWARKK
ncbi:MAG: hypothetical protein V1908_02555 [Candidatus Peregrinibacteria bacterium]